MVQSTTQLDIPAGVQQKLREVRRGIRRYVWLEGLAAIVITLAAAFWLGLFLDWLLEPPPSVRIAGIAITAAVVLWISYRFLLRRMFARLSDASLALVMERRFPELEEHVLTSVAIAAPDTDAGNYDPELVALSHQAAVQAIERLNLKELFRRAPLVRTVAVAIVLTATIPVFALSARDAFHTWIQRIALDPEPWPRRVHLEVVGFPPDSEGIRTHKLAQDDDLELLVHAQTDNHVVPDEVEIRFRLADGRRGRDTLTRVGETMPGTDGFQLYRYEFKHVATDMTFDIVGGDDRVRNLRLTIVDRPELIGTEVQCVYPDYLQRPARSLPITGGMRIPEGTKLAFHAISTKPLTEVRVHTSHDPHDALLPSVAPDSKSLQWDYGTLMADDVLTIQLTDSDGVSCREPYRVSLSVVPDEVPQVAVRLAGIGTAITPDAMLPVVGKISDDYGLDRIWFAYQVGSGTVDERPFSKQPAGAQSVTELDRFDLRSAGDMPDAKALHVKPGEIFYLTVRASDRYNLTGTPHAGASQQFALDVVTVPQLLAMMERRELELRQRFETIQAKLTDTRNLLSRVDEKSAAASTTADDAPAHAPAATAEPGDETPDTTAERSLSRRRLRVAGAVQNIAQSTHEVLGVAEAFEDMHDQIENNRVDNTDLKTRLRDQIAIPLRRLGESRIPELESQLQLVQSAIAESQTETPGLTGAIKLADQILVEFQQVLDRMLELESYNEVVALLRGIIHDQQDLNEKTKQRQTEKLKGLLEN
ncbi:MAG TPA: hypothetical protein VGM76_11090 [Lacipirellulaceae bacterium]|jgi:hypothetical protein